MKKFKSALVLVLLSTTLFAQEIAGIWVGELPQFDDGLPYLLELEITQEGNSLSGTSRIVNPQNINWALMEFTGEISDGKIVITEETVIENWIAPQCLYRKGWLLKEMNGTITVDEETGEERFNGRWFSERRWININGFVQPTALKRPGRFELTKYDPAEEEAKQGRK